MVNGLNDNLLELIKASFNKIVIDKSKEETISKIFRVYSGFAFNKNDWADDGKPIIKIKDISDEKDEDLLVYKILINKTVQDEAVKEEKEEIIETNEKSKGIDKRLIILAILLFLEIASVVIEVLILKKRNRR